MITLVRGHPSAGSRRSATNSHIPGEAGIWIFIFGDMAVFAVLFGTYMYYRAREVALFTLSQQALKTTFGLFNTLLLLLSSLFVVCAVSAVRGRTPRLAPPLIVGAMRCGIGFSVLKIIALREAPPVLRSIFEGYCVVVFAALTVLFIWILSCTP